MELYTLISYELSERLMKRYSTSFSLSSRLFDASIRPFIYAIYGLVRVADEIVDTYRGEDAAERLDALYDEINTALRTHYSVNPIVHAFADTARKFDIDTSLIAPFFESMHMDIALRHFDNDSYASYIYGSAQVVGLMCLRVFVSGDSDQYAKLLPGAQSLGAAYQKVNFLRDLAADHIKLDRMYFPGVCYDTFNEADKRKIIDDIETDFAAAWTYIHLLPGNARTAVRASYYYYHELLDKLQRTPTSQIMAGRIRISNNRKLYLLARAVVKA